LVARKPLLPGSSGFLATNLSVLPRVNTTACNFSHWMVYSPQCLLAYHLSTHPLHPFVTHSQQKNWLTQPLQPLQLIQLIQLIQLSHRTREPIKDSELLRDRKYHPVVGGQLLRNPWSTQLYSRNIQICYNTRGCFVKDSRGQQRRKPAMLHYIH
jgi:hypothetical protein